MQKEAGLSGESLPEEMILYFREIFDVLRCQGFYLSIGGISGDRSPLGRLHDLSADTIRLVAGDDDFLHDGPDRPDAYVFFRELRANLDSGVTQAPDNSCLAPKSRELLTRLTVLLEWIWELGREKKWDSHAHVPEGMAVVIVKEMLGPLVDQEEVQKKFHEIKDDPDLLEDFYQRLRLDVRFLLYPIPQDLLDEFPQV